MTPGQILLLLLIISPFAWWFITGGDEDPLDPAHVEEQRRVDQGANK